MSNKPKFRFNTFAGFTEEWKSNSFSTIAKRVSRQSNSNYLPKLEFEDIISGEGRLNKDISKKFDNRKGIIFEPGYILFGKLRPYLKNWFLPKFNGIALGDFWVFTTKHSPEFVYSLIQTSNFQSVANLSTGTKMPRSDWKTVSTTDFLIPAIEEQKKIGSFFKDLDDTIFLYQQELDALKQTKQGFLQKMFPKEGESVPKVRFSKYSGQWIKEELGALVNKIRSYPLSRDVETESYSEYKYIHYGDIHKKVAKYIDDLSYLPNIQEGNYEWLEEGDLVLADASEDYQGIANAAILAIKPPKKVIAGLHTIALRPNSQKVNSLYLYYLLESSLFKKFGYKTGTGMKVFGISTTNLLKFNAIFPTIGEQSEIGDFFRRLDEVIKLKEQELEALKQTKKGFLQKMFV